MKPTPVCNTTRLSRARAAPGHLRGARHYSSPPKLVINEARYPWHRCLRFVHPLWWLTSPAPSQRQHFPPCSTPLLWQMVAERGG